MNLTKFLPNFGKSADRELTEEEWDELDAEAKKDRIQFHRDHVRNGPRQLGHLTPGRHQSKQRRRQEAKTRKANRKYRMDWMRAQMDLAKLRGQLEAVGALPVFDGFVERGGTQVRMSAKRLDGPLRQNALKGLKDGYGALVEETLDIGEIDLGNVDHVDALIEAALHHYTLATQGKSA